MVGVSDVFLGELGCCCAWGVGLAAGSGGLFMVCEGVVLGGCQVLVPPGWGSCGCGWLVPVMGLVGCCEVVGMGVGVCGCGGPWVLL